MPALVLFNQDLRIIDNPAFDAALANHNEILPIFILDEVNCRTLGSASKWFLHFALQSLQEELQKNYNLKLLIKKGDSLKILEEIFAEKTITEIYFNKLIEPYNIKLQNQIAKLAKSTEIKVNFFKAQTLFDPSEIKNGSGTYFKVFTPFCKNCLSNSNKITAILKSPKASPNQVKSKIKIDDLNLLPKINWDKNFKKIWQFDHKKLRQDLLKFLQNKLQNYKQARDFPALEDTSKLSPYLHFGMISVREVFNLAMQFEDSEGRRQFIFEIMWREFSHHLLFHFPELLQKNFRSDFDKFPWIENKELLQKWQKGKTGFPIVDAGMQELWQTGWIHNRVRMIVASFLIKDLLIDWREGEKWFWDCLVDADLASNAASWQWCAGSGADAAPYFRIFNPILQGERFDPDGIYIKKWLPELKNLPAKIIHAPFEIDEKTLKSYGVELGKNYPKPIVNHAKARDMALLIFKTLK